MVGCNGLAVGTTQCSRTFTLTLTLTLTGDGRGRDDAVLASALGLDGVAHMHAAARTGGRPWIQRGASEQIHALSEGPRFAHRFRSGG